MKQRIREEMFEPPDTIETLASAIDRSFFAPLRRPRTRRVGVELELPVWIPTPGKATDFDAVHEATEEFLARFDFPDTALDDTGALYRARDPESGDELSFDCSFNTLELSFGPAEFLKYMNRDSLATLDAVVEPLLATASPGERFQFERTGYFVADEYDHAPEHPVFNRTVTLKGSYKPA